LHESLDALHTWVQARRVVLTGRSRVFARQRLVRGVLRSVAWPASSELTGGRRVGVAARPLLEALFPDRAAAHWDALQAELDEIAAALARRYADGRWLLRPESWAAGQATCDLVYGVVRTLAPDVVLETGTANGHMTVHLLQALQRNGRGHLHSTDHDGRAGPLVDAAERTRWTLHVVDWKRPRRSWAALVHRIGPLDVFFHDSDHAYTWQRREYEDALRHLRPGGVLASDDIQASYAYLDACGAHGLQPVILVEEWKMAGVARLP
jgi:predicted O-methyltransferase YrrM